MLGVDPTWQCSRASLLRSRMSRAAPMEMDWLRWLVALSAVHRKVKSTIDHERPSRRTLRLLRQSLDALDISRIFPHETPGYLLRVSGRGTRSRDRSNWISHWSLLVLLSSIGKNVLASASFLKDVFSPCSNSPAIVLPFPYTYICKFLFLVCAGIK